MKYVSLIFIPALLLAGYNGAENAIVTLSDAHSEAPTAWAQALNDSDGLQRRARTRLETY